MLAELFVFMGEGSEGVFKVSLGNSKERKKYDVSDVGPTLNRREMMSFTCYLKKVTNGEHEKDARICTLCTK